MIHVEVNHNDLAYVQARLKWKRAEAPKALRNAVNDTATSARKLLADAAQREYAVKKGGFYNHAKIKKATLANLTAEIRVNGRPLTLPRYHTTAPKSGAKTEVLQGSGLKTIVGPRNIKAFTGRGKNGLNSLIYQRESKARTPLKALHGPSVPKMMEKVYEGRNASAGLKKQVEALYQKNVKRQIERVITG